MRSILLRLIIEGPDLSPTLVELDEEMVKLKELETYHSRSEFQKTHLHTLLPDIVGCFKAAAEKWDPIHPRLEQDYDVCPQNTHVCIRASS